MRRKGRSWVAPGSLQSNELPEDGVALAIRIEMIAWRVCRFSFLTASWRGCRKSVSPLSGRDCRCEQVTRLSWKAALLFLRNHVNSGTTPSRSGRTCREPADGPG